MGRKLNSSQPMVVDVMLSPLSEMFSIQPSGDKSTLRQWYYADATDSPFVPDHTINPLILVPTLKVFDPDTNNVYTPVRGGNVRWFELQNENGTYKEIGVDIPSSQSGDYEIRTTDGSLVVRKNVTPDAGLTLACEYQYLDPRDITVVGTVRAEVTLTTNRASVASFPQVVIESEKRSSYNRFTDSTSRFTFNAKVLKNGEDITSSSSIRWYASENGGAETLIDTNASDGFKQFLCYVSGQGTPTLVVDAMYTNNITIIARVIDTDSSPNVLFPTKDFVTLAWDEFKLKTIVKSDSSGAVRQNTSGMTFDTIMNIRHNTLTDAQKKDNMLINWKRRNAAGSTVTDMGWGQSMYVSGSALRSARTQVVYAEVTMVGAFERVTDSGATVTDESSIVVDRSL